MLLELRDLTVSLGGKTILSHVSMEIREHDKIALVGPNGAGKTTLLRTIMGEIDPDADDKRSGAAIRSSRRLSYGFLRQLQDLDDHRPVEAYMRDHMPPFEPFSKEQYLFEMEFMRLFTGFGFAKSDRTRSMDTFSGGERTKLAFILLLLQKPDLLLCDEPTNHLDMETVEWLEEYMKTYPKAVIFVSHDRFFLDRVAQITYELSNHELVRYAGNYSQYRAQKRKNNEIQMKQYLAQQEEIKRLNELISKFKNKPNKAGFARAKKTQLQRIRQIQKPKEDMGTMTAEFVPRYPGPKWIYEAQDLIIGYQKNHPLAELSLRIKRGQKIAVIGRNGIGKSTFLKTVCGDLQPLKGTSRIFEKVLWGYFDQKAAEFSDEKSVLEHFRAHFGSLSEKELHSRLACFLFRGEDVNKRVSSLSGGERARLYLAELMQSGPNFLIMDEPTNHMDIPAKEMLESIFSDYKGSILFVSHDRYFVSKVADAILLFDEGMVYYYPFGYEHYLTHMKSADSAERTALVLAKDQALVAGLQAVPKPQRMQAREQSTEVAYVQWRLRLAAEPLQEAWSALDKALLDGEEKQIEIREDALTTACLDWYQIYLDIE